MSHKSHLVLLLWAAFALVTIVRSKALDPEGSCHNRLFGSSLSLLDPDRRKAIVGRVILSPDDPILSSLSLSKVTECPVGDPDQLEISPADDRNLIAKDLLSIPWVSLNTIQQINIGHSLCFNGTLIKSSGRKHSGLLVLTASSPISSLEPCQVSISIAASLLLSLNEGHEIEFLGDVIALPSSETFKISSPPIYVDPPKNSNLKRKLLRSAVSTSVYSLQTHQPVSNRFCKLLPEKFPKTMLTWRLQKQALELPVSTFINGIYAAPADISKTLIYFRFMQLHALGLSPPYEDWMVRSFDPLTGQLVDVEGVQTAIITEQEEALFLQQQEASVVITDKNIPSEGVGVLVSPLLAAKMNLDHGDYFILVKKTSNEIRLRRELLQAERDAADRLIDQTQSKKFRSTIVEPPQLDEEDERKIRELHERLHQAECSNHP